MVLGSSPVLDPAERPAMRSRSLLIGKSGRSLQSSNPESVNNESLDLDERDIYQHFARRRVLGVLASFQLQNAKSLFLCC